jgi:FMN phosphatase YigB (HAD superfamily)
MFDLPDLVIFDLDNTLYDFQVANNSGELALCHFLSANLNLPKEEVERLMKESRGGVKARLEKTASSHSRLLYIREFLQENRVYMHATFALECEQIFWRAYLEKTRLFSGAEEFISLLRLSKIRLFLVTDLSTQIQLRKLAWLGLDKSFELIITSEEAGGDKETGKPEKLLRKYVTPGTRTWSIGDKDWDHIFPTKSKFFKKMPSGGVTEKAPNRIEFSSFSELLSRVNF